MTEAGSGLVALVMMAGKGTRMKSDLPKVLHRAAGREIGRWVIGACEGAGVKDFRLIVGHRREQVIEAFEGYPAVVQEPQNGTGHAVQIALENLDESFEHVLVLSGDTPLITAELLRKLIDEHLRHKPACTMLSCTLEDPTGYGRVFTNAEGLVTELVEQKDATDEQRAHREVNPAFYVFDRGVLDRLLDRIEPSPVTGEIYLTAIFGLIFAEGLETRALHVEGSDRLLGVNTTEQLAVAEKILEENRG